MYKFDPKGDPPETAFRAIALDQLGEALSDLDRPDSSGRTAVHEGRRRTKKLRGLLRLVRAGFADFGRENRALRDAAALLSHLRDREVREATLDELARWRSSPTLDRLLAGARDIDPHDDAAALAAFRTRLEEIRSRSEHWTLSRSGVDTLRAGVKRTYRSARRRMAKAQRTPTPASFHDWRKSNKNHGFGLDLLRKAAPEVLGAELEIVDKLSATLGQHHDLVVLRTAAAGGQLPLSGTDELTGLNALIGERLGELEREAFELGRQIYAETPRRLARRIMTYWASA